MIKMTLQDAAFLEVETAENTTHATLMMIFSLPDKAGKTFVKNLYEQLLSYPVTTAPYNYVLVPSSSKTKLPSWRIETNIDLEYHLRREAVASPGGEKELGQLMSRIQTAALDRTKPLWELVLIEGLAKRRFAMCLKTHHAIADGMRVMRVLQRCMGTTADSTLPPPWAITNHNNYQEPTRSFADTLKTVGKLIGQRISQGKPSQPIFPTGTKTLLNGKITANRRLTTQTISLAAVRALSKQSDTTINDVLLAVTSGALRRYLAVVDTVPSESLIAAIPIALPMYENLEVGNAIGGMTIAVASHIDDPKARLLAINQATTTTKSTLNEIPDELMKNVNAFGMYYMAAVPPQNKKGEQRKVMQSFTFSNVPGPQAVQYFHGARLEHMYPASVLMPDQRLNITAFSYNGKIDYGIVGCPDKLPHLQKIAEFIPASLAELEAAFT